MIRVLFLALLFSLVGTACYTDSGTTEPEDKKVNSNIPVIQVGANNISINYLGTINNLPARVRLVLKNGGQKIRTDISIIDGNKKNRISYWKINDEIFVKDFQTKVVSQKDLAMDDFIHFFYLPSEQFLSKAIQDKNLEIMENDSFLGEMCTHFQMNTDTSHAEFHVWNNILLIINTEMNTGESSYNINLEAVSLEKNWVPNDSLFIRPS